MSGAPSRLARAALTIAAVTAVARLVGFARTALAARVLGASPLGDAYTAANTLPNILFELVAGGALASLVVPLLSGAATRDPAPATLAAAAERSRISQSASAVLTWTVVVLAPVSLLAGLGARPLLGALLAPSPSRAAELRVGTEMLRVFAPQILLYGVGIAVTGVLQAYRRFTAPALAPLLSSVTVIGAYALFVALPGGHHLADLSPGPQAALAVGTTAGVVALTVPLLLPLRRLGLTLRPTLRFPSGQAGQARRLAFAGVAALTAQQLGLAVAVRLASAQPGSVVVFTLAQTVVLVPWAVLAVPIATSAYPSLGGPGGDRVLAGALRSQLLVLLAAAAALAAAAGPVARVLLAGGAPDLATAVAASAPGLIGFGVIALLTRALYAADAGRAAALAVSAGWAVTVLAAVLSTRADPHAARPLVLSACWSGGMCAGAAGLAVAVARRRGPHALGGAARLLGVGVPSAALGAAAGAVAAAALGRVLPAAVLSRLVCAGLGGGLAAAVAVAGVAAGMPAVPRALLGRLRPVAHG